MFQKNSAYKIQQFLSSHWIFLLILILGIQLKFLSLEDKYLWYDEVETMMHTSGISDSDYYSLMPENEIKNIGYYQDLIHVNKHDYSIWAQLTGLFSMPQLTPLHPALLIFWTKLVGDDFLKYRLFNLFILILIFPFLFSLCKTLFKTNIAGWIGISLFCISPFFDIYTKEARYIVLWSLLIIVNLYLFLKIIENNKSVWWYLYVCVSILALYTSLLSCMLFLSQYVYVLIRYKELRTKCLKYMLLVGVFYLPWIYSLYIHRNDVTHSLQWLNNGYELSVFSSLYGQLLGFSHVFASFQNTLWNYVSVFAGKGAFHLSFDIIISFLINFLILFAIIKICKDKLTSKNLILLLIIIPFLFIYVYDFIKNGRVSFIWRYQIISFIGVFLVVVYYLSTLYRNRKTSFLIVYFSLSFIGILSIYTISLNKCWTTYGQCNGWSSYNSSVLLDASERPLVVTDFTFWGGPGGFIEIMANCKSKDIDILYLSPKSQIQLKGPSLNTYSEIYLIHASSNLIERVKTQLGGTLQQLPNNVWMMPTNDIY